MARRAAQLLWVLDYLDDIASDMSVFHRVDDIRAMPGRRFFILAPRLSCYAGAMHARAVEAAQGSSPLQPQQEAAPAYRAPVRERELPPATPQVLAGADPVLAGMFSFSTFAKE